MKNSHCLFSAPHSFLNNIKDDFNSILSTEFQEIWDRSDLNASDSIKVWIVNPGQKFVVDKRILKLFPSLELIITPSTGKNHINEQDCRNAQITVLGLLDTREILNTISASSEFTFLLILNALRRLDFAVNEIYHNRWRDNEDQLRGYELNGRLVGIIGLGRIGSNIAKWCEAFGANISYYDPYVKGVKYKSDSLRSIFSNSDIVCISCALTVETIGLVDKNLLTRLKHNAALVNTSRGEILNEKDLIEIINNREDIHVCLDVLSGEVTNSQFHSPLIDLHKEGRITITPHIAGATYDSQIKAAEGALTLLRNYFNEK